MSSCSGYTYIAEYIPTYNVVGIPIAAGILFPAKNYLLVESKFSKCFLSLPG